MFPFKWNVCSHEDQIIMACPLCPCAASPDVSTPPFLMKQIFVQRSVNRQKRTTSEKCLYSCHGSASFWLTSLTWLWLWIYIHSYSRWTGSLIKNAELFTVPTRTSAAAHTTLSVYLWGREVEERATGTKGKMTVDLASFLHELGEREGEGERGLNWLSGRQTEENEPEFQLFLWSTLMKPVKRTTVVLDLTNGKKRDRFVSMEIWTVFFIILEHSLHYPLLLLLLSGTPLCHC